MELSRLVFFLKIACFGFLLPVWFMGSATLSIASAQEPKPDESETRSKVPFRRIFIPAEEVNELDLDGYEPVSAQEFDEYVEGQNKPTFTSLPSDSEQGISLLSSYYAARLVGPDLFSERSKLVLSSPARSGERRTLSPWSLAVNNKQPITNAGMPVLETVGNSGGNSISTVSTWTYDTLGLPRLPAHRSEKTWGFGFEPERGGTVHWFGWSARSTLGSQPNRLRFDLEIPRCADSCLLLQLPPRAIVQESRTACRRIDQNSDLQARFHYWPEVESDLAVRQSPRRTTDSIWLIELSGSQNASFTVVLGTGDREPDSLAKDPVSKYSYLVRSQKLEHTIEQNWVRTMLDLEIMHGKDDGWYRLVLPSRSKLRFLKVNQEDKVDWQVVDDMIQWKIPKLTLDPAAAKTNRAIGTADFISAELITPVELQPDQTVVLPSFVLERSYVMSGRTSVQASEPWRLGSAICDSSKLVEFKPTTLESKNTERIDFSWQAFPPSCSVQVRPSQTVRQCESFSQVDNESDGIRLTTHLRLAFRDQDSNRLTFRLGDGWEIRSVRSKDVADPVALFSSDVLPAGPTLEGTDVPADKVDPRRSCDFVWDAIALSRVAEIEMVCFYKVPNLDSNPVDISVDLIRIPSTVVLELPGWNIRNNAAVVPSASFPLLTKSVAWDSVTAQTQLGEWEKQLPITSEIARVLLPKNRAARASELALPAIVFQRKEVRKQVAIESRIVSTSRETLVVEHDLNIDDILGANSTLEIELDDVDAKWFFLEGNRWVSVQPTVAADAGLQTESKLLVKSIWSFDLGGRGNSCKLRATMALRQGDDGRLVVPLPRIKNGQVRSQIVSAWPDQKLSLETEEGSWEFDSLGNRVLKLDPVLDPRTLSVKQLSPIERSLWSGLDCQMDVAVDAFGSQRATCVVRLKKGGFQAPIVFELEDSWLPISVDLPNGKIGNEVGYRLDGQRLIIDMPNRSAFDSKSVMEELPREVDEIRIQLNGPRLKSSSDWLAYDQGFAFRWPRLGMDGSGKRDPLDYVLTSRLWLPKDVVIYDHPFQARGQQGAWPLWTFSAELATNLLNTFGYAPRNNAIDPSQNASFSTSFQLEGLGDTHWRMAIEKKSSESIDAGTRFEIESGAKTLRLARWDRNSAIGVIVFAFFVLVTPVLVRRRPRATVVMVFTLVILAHVGQSVFCWGAFLALLGITGGFVLLVIYRCTFGFVSKESPKSLSVSRPWMPWNDRENNVEPQAGLIRNGSSVVSISKLPSVLLFTFGWLALLGSDGRSLLAQEGVAGDSADIFDVVVPMDREGELSGTSIYIPKNIAQQFKAIPEKAVEFDTGTRILSARHTLSLGMRGRADLITMTYEFWVGDDLAPVRLPVNNDQVQSLRFVLDNVDLSPGSRLRKSGSEWDWIPEKSGKRTLRISAQPVMKSTPTDQGRDGRGAANGNLLQQVDIALLPVANATIEIELDPQLMVDIVAQGQVNNPAAGKYVAQLGALDRLQCRILESSLNSTQGFSNPNTTLLDGPTMSTELLLVHDSLQAKTIIEFPKGVSLPREIAIEADLPWIPIGTQWGDTKWVDVRSGSTLARRRYILEWNADANPLTTSPAQAMDREISVVWIPQTNSQNLNVLFAECLDRRTKLGTLRYHRADGAKWSIDGINTWVPAISSKERLEWPELTSMPFATTLRIPITGGFGVLKPKVQADRQQARITTKWLLEVDSESLSSRVELLGGISDSDLLTVDLPAGFRPMNVTNRTGSVRFLQSEKQGRIQLQLLAERRSLELNELMIQATRETKSYGNVASPQSVKSGEVPWLKLPSSIIVEQTIDLFVSDQLRVQLDPLTEAIQGKGGAQSVAALVQGGTEPNKLSTGNNSYQAYFKQEVVENEIVENQGDTSTTSPEIDSIDNPVNGKKLAVRSPESSSISQSIHSIGSRVGLGSHGEAVKLSSNPKGWAVVESSYWIDGLDTRRSPSELFRWELGDQKQGLQECEVLSVQLDGNPIEFRQSNNLLECQVPLTKLCSELVLVTRQEITFDADSVGRILVPNLQSHTTGPILFVGDASQFSIQHRGETQSMVTAAESAGVLAEKWCDLFSRSANMVANLNVPVGSHWERWQRYWNLGAFEKLQAWSVTNTSEPIALDATVRKWHQTKSITRSMLDQPAKKLLEAKLAQSGSKFGIDRHSSLSKISRTEGNSQPGSTVLDGFEGGAFSLLGSVLLLVGSMLLWDVSKKPQWYRPWWLLLSVGLLLWATFGVLWPALVLSAVAFAIALDSYLLVSERLRRSETRGLR